MIDRIIQRYPYIIYMSDIYTYENYIGYEKEDGTIVLYENWFLYIDNTDYIVYIVRINEYIKLKYIFYGGIFLWQLLQI